MSSHSRPGSKYAGWLILACAAVLILWQSVGLVLEGPSPDFVLQADDFESLNFDLPGWKTDRLPVESTYMEPNIFKFVLQGKADSSRDPDGRILIRLVHGYNMRDCLRIKGCTVDEIVPGSSTEEDGAPVRRSQLWRVKSSSGDTSLWLSGMLKAGNFSESGLDVRTMPFPRVGIPDDPNWIPRGLTMESLRHPVRNFRFFLRAKWNASRCDLLTFLGLRKPAWASEDALTFLVVWTGRSVGEEDEQPVSTLLYSTYDEVLSQLQAWNRRERISR